MSIWKITFQFKNRTFVNVEKYQYPNNNKVIGGN